MKVARWIGLVCALALLAGCGRGGEKQVTFSTAQVRQVFAAHELRPKWVLDSRTTTHAEIDRRFPLPTDAGGREAIAAARRALYALFDLGPQHPVALLSYGSVDLYVFGHVADARATEDAATTEDRITRVANVIGSIYGDKPSRPVAAALRELSRAS